MKQNEKILVYAVTGFLVVILAIAILFGKELPRRVPPDLQRTTEQAKAPRSLEDIMNERAGLAPAPAPNGGEAGASSADSGTGDAGRPAGTEPAIGEPGAPAGESQGSPSADNRPLIANVQIAPPTAAAMVTEKLGLSREERGFRIVRARPGDTLGGLVQKWCADVGYLEQARGLNETLTTLRVGQEVVLPWVQDEVLLAALEQRANAPLPAVSPAGIPVPAIGAAAAGQAVPAAASNARKYKVRAGDSLWRIAEREVGRKAVPAFLEQVRQLNAGLDTDRIAEGQEILLPPKPNG